MGNVVGEPLRQYVKDQIKTRQNIHGKIERTPEDIIYLNSKTAWVKLASGVRLDDDKVKEMGFDAGNSGIELAKRYVLFGGVSSMQDEFGNPNNGVQPYLRQRGTSTSRKNNIYDYMTGTYNVNARQKDNGTQFGLVPMPGIESLEVKTLNRGSIKRATLKFKAHNKEQFDIIDILYLRLGYTVMIEWGSTMYFQSNGQLVNMTPTLIEKKFFNNGEKGYAGQRKTQLDVLEDIIKERQDKQGNYDGFLAKIINFSWTFTENGEYDITLELISLGDVIESLKTNITPTAKQLKGVGELISEGDSSSVDTKAKNNIISYNMFSVKKIWSLKQPSSQSIFYSLNNNSAIKTGNNIFIRENERITLNPIQQFIKSFSTKQEALEYAKKTYPNLQIETGVLGVDLKDDDKPLYIYLQDILNSDKIDFNLIGIPELTPQNTDVQNNDFIHMNYKTEEDGDEGISDVCFYWRFGYLLRFIESQCIAKINNIKNPQIRIKSEGENKMRYYPNQISFDPQVCIVSGVIDDGSKQILNAFPQLNKWRNEDEGWANIMNIYISFPTIQSSIDSNLDENGNLSLFNFLISLCDSLNLSFAGINNLEPVIDEETNELHIIDSSYSTDSKEEDPDLIIYGYNGKKAESTFVRNIDLKTNITPEYANMVTIGATAGGYVKGTEGTAFSKLNKGITDRFKETISSGQHTSGSAGNDENEVLESYITEFINKGAQMLGLKRDNPKFLDPDIISINRSIVEEYYKYLNYKAQQKARKEGHDFASTVNGFIPFGLGLTMDGISGIKIYNKLNVNTDFLPKNYPDSTKFIIMGITHKLSNQDWETTIETQFVPENLDYKTSKEYYNFLKGITNEHLNNITDGTGPVSTALAGPFREIQTEIQSIAKSNSKLEKSTKTSSTEYFSTNSENNNQCGRYAYDIARKLAEKLLNKTIPSEDNNYAYKLALRKNLINLGIYKQESMSPIMQNASASQIKNKINSLKTNFNYGDVLIYFAVPNPPIKTESGGGYHAQIYTGDHHSGTGWTSSKKSNYGTSFVYSKATKPFDLFWFRIKDEYKK